jgi:hypothetical protein
MLRCLVATCVLLFSDGGIAQDGTPPVDMTTLAVVGDVEWRVMAAEAEAGPDTGMGYLVSADVYGDFKLTVEFWVGADTNSGVFVRCAHADNFNPNDCYEINIWDEHPQQNYRTGSVVTLAAPTAHVDTVGQWNTVEIVLAGNLIVATFNGVETARLVDDRSASGYFALQFGGGEIVRFRNLRVAALN